MIDSPNDFNIQQLLANEEKKNIARYSSAICLTIIAFFFIKAYLIQLSSDGVSFFFFQFSRNFNYSAYETARELGYIISSIISLLLPFWLLGNYLKIPKLSAVPFRFVNTKMLFIAAFCSLGMSTLGSFFTNIISGWLAKVNIYIYIPALVAPDSILASVFYALNMVLIPSILEEIVFRGIILQSLRRFGDGFAIVVSSILFALVHVSPLSIPNALIMGLVMGYFVVITGSLHTGMMMHFIHNSFIYAVSQISRFHTNDGIVLYVAFQAVFVILGVLGLVWLINTMENPFLLNTNGSKLTEKEKIAKFFISPTFVVFVMIIIFQAGVYFI